MRDDGQLLRHYVEEHSQAAFTELVQRHLNVVYYSALRRLNGDTHLAEDVTQRVFADLARKAPSLLERTALTGWLYTSAGFAAAQAVRSQQRRRTHEQEAHDMHELLSTPEPDWNRLRPIIDEAMDELSEPEREVLLLRFFEGLPFNEVGREFSLSADAARMRVERALEKLRGLLAKRGIASTSAALATVFIAQSGIAAPAGVAARIVAHVFTAGGTATAATLGLSWKIMTGLAAGVLGVAIIAYKVTPDAERRDSVVPHSTAAESVSPPSAHEVESKTEQPKERQEVSATPTPFQATAATPALNSEFSRLTPVQKNILKKLWAHHKISPDVPPKHWGFRPALGAPDNMITDFETAAELLRQAGLVAINRSKELVYFTDGGRAFCLAHAQELDNYLLPPRSFHPVAEENLR